MWLKQESKRIEKLQRSSLKALQKTKEAIEQLIVKAVHQYEVQNEKHCRFRCCNH